MHVRGVIGRLVALLPVLALVPAAPSSAASTGVAVPESQRRPNIVVVMADDMRVDDLRFAPQVRRLVGRKGLTFENSFAPYPLCCPARASFLTGVHAHRHHVWSHEKPWGYQSFDDSRTLATSLRRAGYRTGFVGKYLNGYGPDTSQVSGRPSYRYVPQGWSDWRAAFEDPHVPGIHGGTYYYWDTPYNVNGRVDNRYRGRYQTGVIGDFSVRMARRFAERRDPFFMYVNYVAPHHGGPVEPDDPPPLRSRDGRERQMLTTARPQWVRGRFDDVVRRSAGLPRGGGPAEADVSDKPGRLGRLPEFTRRERRALRETTRQRAEAVYVMDRQVRRLVVTLKQTGEWRRTVFVFTSDNGYLLGEHRILQGKIWGHEPSLRVPLLVTGPGMRGRGADGHRRHDPVTTVDLAATVVDLANARPPYRPDGVSRVETMREGDLGWTTPVLHEALHTGGSKGGDFDDVRTAIGIRTSRYAMLRYRNGAELYDLADDAVENRNRWGSQAYREVRDDLMEIWHAMKDCRGAECQVELPDSLSAGVVVNRRQTRSYWDQVDRVYGW
jgi:N-acetylglucosamine-6-sulfatase